MRRIRRGYTAQIERNIRHPRADTSAGFPRMRLGELHAFAGRRRGSRRPENIIWRYRRIMQLRVWRMDEAVIITDMRLIVDDATVACTQHPDC